MSDEFLHELRDTWQSQSHDTAKALVRLRRERWAPHKTLAAQLLGCVLALLLGVWFIWAAASYPAQRLMFALSAAAMLLVVPPLAALSMAVHRSVLGWHDETPQSLLDLGIRRADASLLALRFSRWHVVAIAGFVIVLWLGQGLGFIHAAGFLLFYTALCFVTGIGGLLWMRSRDRRLRSERDAYSRLLAMMQVDEKE